MTSPLNVFGVVREFKGLTDLGIEQLQTANVSQMITTARNPGWLSRTPVGDVTFPEFMLNALPVAGTSGAASAGTAHTHLGGSFAAQVTTATIGQNNSLGGYITVSNPMIVDTVGRIASRDSGTTTVRLEVFRENTDLSLTRIADSAISVNLTAVYQTLSLTDPIVVQEGERYLVRIRNISATALNVYVPAMTQSSLLATNNVFATTGATDTNKTSYTSVEAATFQAATTSLPFFALLSATPGAIEKSYADDFNRTELGPMWQVKTTGDGYLQIFEGRAWAAISGYGTASTATGLYVRPTSSDDQRVDCKLYYTDFSPGLAGPTMHMSRDYSSLVWLAVSDTDASIYSGSSSSVTQRATVAITENDALWSMYYETSTNTYTVLKDNQDIGLSWTDSGNVVPQGYDYRYGGVRKQTVSDGVTLWFGGFLDNWNLRDWTPA